MKELKVFENARFGQIRTAGTSEEPLFCLVDVCKVLGLTPSKVSQRLGDHLLTKYPLETAGGIQFANFVNEDGLYDVIFDSRKKEAKEFRKWVTSEVLPSIRKTGGYLATSADDSPELIMARALQLANITIERYKQQAQLSESTIEAQQEQIKELEPLADYTKNVLQSTETYTMTQVAKEFGYSAVTFAKKLKDAGVLFQQSGTYMLKSKYQSKGYTKTRTAYFTHNNGTMGSKTSLVWTELGRQFLYALRDGRIDSNGNIK